MHATKKGKPWTGAELKIAQGIKESGRTIKESLHLLPERTPCAIKQCIARLPGEKKKRGATGWVFVAMKLALGETPGLTNKQLAHVVGCTRRGIDGVLGTELGNRIYVSGWVKSGVHWTAQYSMGNEPNVPRPPLQTKEEARRNQNAARRAKRGAVNPFAVACGHVSAPTLTTGRIYKQDMSVDEWFQSRVA